MKALVFHKESCIINVANSAGDTPLHYAARWNYSNAHQSMIDVIFLLIHSFNRHVTLEPRGRQEPSEHTRSVTSIFHLQFQGATPSFVRLLHRFFFQIFFALRSSVPSHSVLAATIKEEVDGKEDMSRSRSISVASGASKMSNPKNKRRGSVYVESNNETERQVNIFGCHGNDCYCNY